MHSCLPSCPSFAQKLWKPSVGTQDESCSTQMLIHPSAHFSHIKIQTNFVLAVIAAVSSRRSLAFVVGHCEYLLQMSSRCLRFVSMSTRLMYLCSREDFPLIWHTLTPQTLGHAASPPSVTSHIPKITLLCGCRHEWKLQRLFIIISLESLVIVTNRMKSREKQEYKLHSAHL